MKQKIPSRKRTIHVDVFRIVPRALGVMLGAATTWPLPVAADGVITVAPERTVIVLETMADRDSLRGGHRVDRERLETAAAELQTHIRLMTGVEPQVVASTEVPENRYPFLIDIAPTGTELDTLADQETRWEVTPHRTHLYGQTSRDTLFAVYGFLEAQFGIVWVGPGEANIVRPETGTLTLTPGVYNWIPELVSRSIRLGDARRAQRMGRPRDDLADFQPTLDEHNAFADAVGEWRRRMRMGGNNPGSSHSFSAWWDRFGETHPEYFALTREGTRAPVLLSCGREERSRAFIKICPSNPAVAEQLIADWLPQRERQPIVRAGVNDGTLHFCQCAECLALDVPLEGEAWDTHLTDRYVVLANRVARMARKHREDAFASMYAYQKTLYPPRRERVKPNVVVTLVPYVDPLDVEMVRAHFEGWMQAGATQLTLRPNYHHKYLTTIFPTGIERQMFDVFQLAYANGCIATDYDSLMNNWPVTGIVDYILARAMAEPDKPFEHWAEQYYSAFGAGAGDVREYFEFWRGELWDNRLQPNLIRICNLGGAGDFARGLLWSLGEYYTEADFARAARYLDQAASRDLTAAETARLRQLKLANEHARLTYLAIAAPPYEKPALAETLVAFRRAVKDELPLRWRQIFHRERINGDLIGLELGEEMAQYRTPWLQTDLFWKFKPEPAFKADLALGRPAVYAYDPESQPEWHQKRWEEVADWDNFRTDRAWGRQVEADEPLDASPETLAVIDNYIGVGWYATRQAIPEDWQGREIYLRVGAADESAWVYVNGRFAGNRIFEHEHDWRNSFEIRIDPFIDWDREQQMIMVRVQNTAGLGGLWRPSWVVSK